MVQSWLENQTQKSEDHPTTQCFGKVGMVGTDLRINSHFLNAIQKVNPLSFKRNSAIPNGNAFGFRALTVFQ